MEYNIGASLLKLFIALPIVVVLAYTSLKFGNQYLKKMNSSKLMNVIETVPIFNKVVISVVKIGEEYHVLGIAETNILHIKILDDEEIKLLNETDKIVNQFDWKSFKRKLEGND